MIVPVVVIKEFYDRGVNRIWHVGDEPDFDEYRARVLVSRRVARWKGEPPVAFQVPALAPEVASRATAPDWIPDWQGEACVIVASGPSAPEAGVERARGRARFLAVNDSWQLAPWADALYATDFRWWERHRGALDFSGLKMCQDPKILQRDEWGVHKVEVSKRHDEILVAKFGTIGWGGNSGFGALNLAVQFGANPIVLVGYDMRLDLGVHWHGLHGPGLSNPHAKNVERWRRVVDDCAPTLKAMGIHVFNASPVSSLRNFPKRDLMEALDGRAEQAA